MSENNTNKPKIRFPGFTDTWEQRKVGEFYNFKNGLNKEKEYFGHGVPIVNFTDVFRNRGLHASELNGKVDLSDKEIANFEVKQGDIFFTRTSETIDEIGYPSVMLDVPTNTVFSGFVLRGRAIAEDPLDNNFKRYVFFTKQFREEMKKKSSMTTRALTSGTAIKEMCFEFPKSKEEQAKIGTFFANLDHLITLHQRKLNHLQDEKKSLLQKMFPKNGADVPEIRFPGFTDAWEQRKLNELVTPVVREVPKPNKPYERISVRSHAKGTFRQKVDDPKTVSMDKLYVVKENDLIVNITFAWEHAIAVASKDDDGFLVSHRFPTFIIDKSDINFIRYSVSQESFRRKMEFISPGGAGRNRVLNKKDFVNLKIDVPTHIEEQTKIGNFFANLDHLVTLHQRKLNHLQEQKKSLLQQMFV